MDASATDEIARSKNIYVSTPRTPPDSNGSLDSLTSISTLGTSDATLAMSDEKMEKVNGWHKESVHDLIVDNAGNDAGQGESLIAYGINRTWEMRSRQADPAITYTLDAVQHGRATFDQMRVAHSSHRSVNRFQLQPVVRPPSPVRQRSLAITIERLHGSISPEARTRAFVNDLNVALADMAIPSPFSPTQHPELSPPKIFPPPGPAAPSFDPVKSRTIARGISGKDSVELLPMPSPARPLSDPVKRQVAPDGRPNWHRRVVRRVVALADISGVSTKKILEDEAFTDLGRCRLCVHEQSTRLKPHTDDGKMQFQESDQVHDLRKRNSWFFDFMERRRKETNKIRCQNSRT